MTHVPIFRGWGVVILVALLVLTPSLMAAEQVTVGIVHREDFAYASMMRTAFEMALEAINAADGINGRQLSLAYADDKGDVKIGEQAIRELVREQHAVLLVGGYSSSNTLKMAYTAERLDVPFLVCTAADDRITQHGLKNIYRLNPPAWEYTSGLEAFLLAEVGPKSMSIVYENSPFGTGSALRMMWFCRENDIVIKSIQPYFKKGATSEYLNRLLVPIQKDAPEVLFLVSYLDDAVMLVNEINRLKINALLCGGAGGFTHEAFNSKTGNTAEYLITATLWSPSPYDRLAEDFNRQFIKRVSLEPDYHAAEAYSALLVAAEALRTSASMKPADIRKALDAIDMQTPFGRVVFTEYAAYRRQNISETQVLQVINGRFETVWPKNQATADFVLPDR